VETRGQVSTSQNVLHSAVATVPLRYIGRLQKEETIFSVATQTRKPRIPSHHLRRSITVPVCHQPTDHCSSIL